MVLNMYIFKYVVQTLYKHDDIDMHCIIRCDIMQDISLKCMDF